MKSGKNSIVNLFSQELHSWDSLIKYLPAMTLFTKPFFIDAMDKLRNDGVQGLFLDLEWSDVKHHTIAQAIIEAYWRRYCPKALKDGDIRVLAAVFRKGPRGFQNPTGIKYGKRALALYYEYSKRSSKAGIN